jgi:hypothetical protein
MNGHSGMATKDLSTKPKNQITKLEDHATGDQILTQKFSSNKNNLALRCADDKYKRFETIHMWTDKKLHIVFCSHDNYVTLTVARILVASIF